MKNLNKLKKCPYFSLLVISGICVSLYSGLNGHENSTGTDLTVSETAETAEAEANEQLSGREWTFGKGIPAPEKSVEIIDEAGQGDENETGVATVLPETEHQETGQGSEVTSENDASRSDSVDGTVADSDPAGDQETTKATDIQTADAGITEQDGTVEEPVTGITEFEYYEPKQSSSPYYSDPGKIALTTQYPYETVDDSYFADAAFIGDSRTLGLSDYSGLSDTDFFCDSGFCTYLWKNGEKVTYQNEDRKVSLDEIMGEKSYKKIYLMLGLNDCGYGNIADFQQRYRELVLMLHGQQPDAVIYMLGNMHLSKEKSDGDAVYNNDDINAHNVAIAELADGITYFYLDSFEQFMDEQGNLRSDLTFDGTHLYADGYLSWVEYFRQHAVVRG